MQDPRIVKTGIALGESPRWHDNRIWLADWGALEVIAVVLDGESEVIVSAPAVPCCFDWLPDGRLIIVSSRDRLLLSRAGNGPLLTHADLTGLSDHGWNDIVVDGRGNAYIGNVGFDFPGGEYAPGLLAMARPDGSSRIVAEGVAFPNGLLVTPDNSTLILAESYGHKLTAFDIAPDGGLSGQRVWADLGDGVPDGICLDAEGAVWYADVPNKRCVRVHEGGEVLQTVDHDRGCFACMLGGPDRRTLFVVAAEWPAAMTPGTRTGQLLAVEAPAAGVGWP